MKSVLVLLSVFLYSCICSAQVDNYKEALKIIMTTDEYKSYTKSQKKYHVSDQLIIFSKMGKMFTEELSKHGIGLSDYDIVLGEKKNNLKNRDLLSLNKRKCSKLKIYFSEEKEGVFFAELIKESKKEVEYDKITYFGISHIFMFKASENKVQLLDIKVVNNN